MKIDLEARSQEKYGRPLAELDDSAICAMLEDIVREHAATMPLNEGKRRLYYLSAEFLIGQVAIEVRLSGYPGKQRAGVFGASASAIGTPEPVDPGGLLGQRGGHFLDGRPHSAPILRAQRRTHLPLRGFVGQKINAQRWERESGGLLLYLFPVDP